jgi:protein-S-isoprenylcysteine O-methyltransferase Ste14
MSKTTLAIIFLVGAVAGFFLAGAGDNSGNQFVFWLGVVILVAAVAAWIKWWSSAGKR